MFIAYAPESYGQNLGRAYNDYMNRLGPDDYAVFIDHDAMLAGNRAPQLLRELAEEAGDAPVLFAARTNRIFCAYQRLTQFADVHELDVHDEVAGRLHEMGEGTVRDVTPLPPISGLVMMLSKKTWERAPFIDGFLRVDNAMHENLRDAGGKICLPDNLYAYHFYRADGDSSHLGFPLDEEEEALPPVAALVPTSMPGAGPHMLRNFVYSADERLILKDYLDLLAPGEWACFTDIRAIHCERNWYPRLCALIAKETGERILVLNSSGLDAEAPPSSDHRRHRRFAAELRDKYGDAIRPLPAPHWPGIGGFVISRDMLASLVKSSGKKRKASDLPELAVAAGVGVALAKGIYVQAGRPLKDAGARAPDEVQGEPDRKAAIAASLRESRRVAMISAHPHLPGAESAIRHLALEMTKAGDHVTLFTPHDRKSTIDRPNFVLRNFSDDDHCRSLLEEYHRSLPFDCILTQGARRAGTMALETAERFGLPVAMRMRPPEILLDKEIGYGDRREAARAEVIAHNVASAHHIIVTTGHLRRELLSFQPEAKVSVIGDGVDCLHFHPHESDYLRKGLPRIGPATRTLLIVGQNKKANSLHLALDALARLVEVGRDVFLVHAGESGQGKNLDAYAAALGMGDRFHTLGKVRYLEMPALYSACDMFLSVSPTKAFSSARLEAMASGLPCVAFEDGAMNGSAAGEIGGFAVERGDVTALVEAIASLLDDDMLRARMGAQARQAAEALSWKDAARSHREVLRQIGAGQ